MAGNAPADLNLHLGDAGLVTYQRSQLLCQRVPVAGRREAQLDLKHDLGVRHAEIPDRVGRDQVLLQMRFAPLLESGLDAVSSWLHHLAPPQTHALLSKQFYCYCRRRAGPSGSQQLGLPCACTEIRSEEHTSELQSRENLVCR